MVQRSSVRYIHIAPAPGNYQPAAQLLGTPALGFVGDTVQLTLRKLLPDGSHDDSGTAVLWSSSDRTIAAVSLTGLVTLLAVGVATITATVDGRSYPAIATVLPGSGFALLTQDATALLAQDGSELSTQGL